MKRSAPALLATGIIIILAASLVGTLIYIKNQPPSPRGKEPVVQISPMEPDSSIWGENFPNQYDTLLKTETNDTLTTYGGSKQVSKLEQDPRLLTLFAGYGFSKEYNEDRGHLNSLTDVRKIARVNETTTGTCLSCKSSDNPHVWEEMGMAEFDKLPFTQVGENLNNPIGCANCHDAETMKLIVTNLALEEALAAQGKDWRTFTRQEMRTVVCANCHVEYYFAGEGKYLTFPWEGGTKIENIAAYYQDEGFKDWEHPQSGAPMIKMQHPEYEFFTADSTHYLAGAACADCHMPYTRNSSTKFSTHDVKSPLLNAEAACGACHTDVEYVTRRVAIIQNQVHETMIATEDAIVDAIAAIEKAAASPGVNEEVLKEARGLHRESQLRWDFVAAENSMGFHNPEEALRILARATDLARQAQLKAVQAAGSVDAILTSSQ